MTLSTKTAKIIVEEISGIIGRQINMMNAEGIIIASTDAARVGTFHAAAKKIIDENLSEITVHSDTEYAGALSGTNIAVRFKGAPVAVIGVTGPYQEVVKYGQMLKKMTEILMRDEYYKQQSDTDKRIKNRFLNEWLYGSPETIDRRLENRGKSLGIDISIPRRVVVFEPVVQIPETTDIGGANAALSDSEIDGALKPSEIQRHIDNTWKTLGTIIGHEKNAVMLVSGTVFICALSSRSDKQLLDFVRTVRDSIQSKYPVILAAGLDSKTDDYRLINSARLKAEKALKTCLRSPSKEPRLYDTINMEIFSGEIPDPVKREYITRIFKSYSEEDIRYWINLLDTLYQEEGSIAKTAIRLFMHKNTLQYQLNKLKQKTGYDPRSIRFSSLFYNAIHFYRDIENR
ncbi:helix-turn-helix domain-containing protein [Treponema sp. OMZ 840]|uniref:CdaR family transcriptional regulator n=1 Tax=Treponema sp. OMZ 840 TaxID=244313 RepID=UPI003D8C50E0